MKDDDLESPGNTMKSSPGPVRRRSHRSSFDTTGQTEEEKSEDLSLAAAILHSTSTPARANPRFDVTAAGTTARLSTSLVGNMGTNHNNAFDDDDSDVADGEEQRSSSLWAPKPEEDDPESTPLLGNGRLAGPLHQTNANNLQKDQMLAPRPSPRRRPPVPNRTDAATMQTKSNVIQRIAAQIPAVVLIGLFHLMIGIPFGVSYFPVGWRPMDNPNAQNIDTGDVAGSFPLPGKEAVGIRMFLFSTAVGQIVFSLQSQFHNAIGLQMVENVPFCQTLAATVIQHQGYGLDALSTLLFIFAMSSVVVGCVFWVLGRYRLGRVIYFFPTHVLMGCIGGIGLFLARTAMEVSMNEKFDWALLFGEKLPLVSFVFGFEIVLRVLQRLSIDPVSGESRYPLLSPVYFCLITPVFYGILRVLNISIQRATTIGFFFPPIDTDEEASSGILNIPGDLFDLWSVLDIRSISWAAVWDSIPTIVALTLFSLIHVPINIPAFAISSNTEVDINNELVAHGYSNLIMGLAGGGGLQNYMAYTQSVLYSRSGGKGRASGIAVAVVTMGLFVVGPRIASYIPRCMAGTLLFHVGSDLFLEAVYDSIGRFDKLEYTGIWLIVIVMAVAGLEAAMIAGVVAAVSTYAVQSMTYLNPIRGTMSATTFRSSRYDRPHGAHQVLDDPTRGRSRILVIQLQGHLFFGNTAQLTESVQNLVQTGPADTKPLIVIMDFMLVLGIDSSAAQAMGKLRKLLSKQFSVDPCIFVTGSQEGFPTEFSLSKELSQPADSFTGSHVVPDLDHALRLAEDSLLARQDPALLQPTVQPLPLAHRDSGLTEEKEVALKYLSNLAVKPVTLHSIETLFACFEREVYTQDEIIWRQGVPGDSAKVIVRGTLVAVLEQEAGTSESVPVGNLVGELGLVYGSARMSTVICESEECVLYSLSRAKYEELVASSPIVARIMDMICIKYLTSRVQHVSNRIFETRCLPI